MTKMAGLAKKNSLPMKLFLKLVTVWCLLAQIIGTGWMVHAQSSRDARVELAAYTEDGQLLLQVSVPRSQSIESAELTLGANTTPIVLRANPLALAMRQWFILDIGNEMINAYPRMSSALATFLEGQPADTEVGFIFFNESVTLVPPTTDLATWKTELSRRSALAGMSACSGDALAELAQAYNPSTQQATRVLVIAGARTRQGNCQNAPLASSLGIPIDLIVLDTTIDDDYLDLADQTGGQARQTNISTITARLNEVNTLWEQPIYALQGQWSGEAPTEGILSVRLLDGSNLTLPVSFTVMENASVVEVANLTPTPAIIYPDTPTPTFTSTITPSPTASLTYTPTEEVTIAASLTETPLPALASTESGVASVGDQAPPSFPTSTATPPPAPVTTDTTTTSDESEASINPLILIGGAMVLLALIVAGVYMAWPRRPRPAPTATYYPSHDITDYEHTYIESDAPEDAFDLYGLRQYQSSGTWSGASGTRIDFASPQEHTLIDQRPSQLSQEDELLITRMSEDEDFKAVQKTSPSSVVGWLRWGDKPEHPITASGLVIGRKANCDFVIANDAAISNEHVRLSVAAGDVLLEVLSHHNPVKVGGVILRLGQIRRLMSKDVIQFSEKTRLVFIQHSTGGFDEEATRI